MFGLNALRGCCVAALSCCALSTAAGAESIDTGLAPSEPRMLVPGSRLPLASTQFPASITVITAERIAASPAHTVADLLAMEAGVAVRSLYGTRSVRSTVDLRGFGATGGQNTLILLDGRRLNDVDLSTVNFAAIPLHNIERIEILRGSGSVLYGDGAAGGSINIVTRRPAAGEFSGLLGAAGGSYDSRELEGRLSVGAQRASLSVAADALDSDGSRDNNDLSQRNLQAELRWDGATTNLYLKTGASDQELRLPGVRRVDPAANLNELRTDRDGSASPHDFAEERAAHVTIGVSRRFGERAGLLIDAGYRDRRQEAFYDDYTGFPPFLPPGAFADFLDTRLRGFSITPRAYLDHRLFGLGGQLTVGADYYDYDYASGRALNPGSIAQPIHRLAIDQRNLAFYVSDLSQLTGRLTMNVGARVQRVKLSAIDNFDPGAPGALDKFESAADPFSRTDTETLLEAGLRYTFDNGASLFLRGGRSARFATVDELFEFGSTFTREFSPLKPQTARHLDFGAGYAAGPFDGTVTAYGMNLDDEIHFNPLTFANENLDATRRLGVETQIGFQLLEGLMLRASYTWQKSTFRDGPFDGNDVPLAARSLANLAALWTIVPAVKLAAVWRHVDAKPFDNDESGSFGQRIPSHRMVDLKLTAEYGHWTLSAMIDNATDEQAFDYAVASLSAPGRFNAYPLPGRNFTVGLRREFR